MVFYYFCSVKKNLLHIVILWWTLFAASCVNTGGKDAWNAPPEYVAIDSLMWQHPDSALTCLERFDSIGYGTVGAPNKQYLDLLHSEAIFKVRNELVLAEEVDKAAVCFDSMAMAHPQADNLVFLSARAHNMSGNSLNKEIIAHNDPLILKALQEHYKALEIMESHFSAKQASRHQLEFMSIVSSKIAGIYSMLFIHKPTVYFTKKSLEINRSMAPPQPSSIARNLFFLGYEFDKTEQYDSALYYYDQAIELIPDTSELNFQVISLRRTINAYKLTLDGATAIEQLKRSLSSCPRILTSNVLSTIGWVYFEEKQYDSALAYLQPVFDNSTDEKQQMQTAQTLSQIYETLGDSANMNKYSRFFTQNVTLEQETLPQKVEYERLFNDYIQRREELIAQQEKQKTIRTTLAVVLPMAVVAVVLSIVAMKRRGKKQMEQERYAHRMEQTAMSGRLKRSNQELRELKDQMLRQNDTASKPDTQAASFAEEPICRLIMERVNEGQFKSQMDCTIYKDYALGKEQVMALREAADRHFNQFTVRLAKAYPNLTKGDLDYCCLYLLGLSDADISALMQKAYPTVSHRARKMKAIFENEAPLPTTLLDFAKE